ncbi:hypothetical protein ACVWZ6_007031 [Bradyrhizobium sp. GM6.1]
MTESGVRPLFLLLHFRGKLSRSRPPSLFRAERPETSAELGLDATPDLSDNLVELFPGSIDA